MSETLDHVDLNAVSCQKVVDPLELRERLGVTILPPPSVMNVIIRCNDMSPVIHGVLTINDINSKEETVVGVMGLNEGVLIFSTDKTGDEQ